jgi:hypothetical protein
MVSVSVSAPLAAAHAVVVVARKLDKFVVRS